MDNSGEFSDGLDEFEESADEGQAKKVTRVFFLFKTISTSNRLNVVNRTMNRVESHMQTNRMTRLTK